MNNSATAASTSADSSMEKIRELVIGKDDKFVQQAVQRNAKNMVVDVVSEALHEREGQDGSVNKVLVPLVERSLHRSIEANSEKIVGTLYPLVGTLVRKAVSAFLVDFVERTNALIEHSLSPKSITWRLKAWQAGIRYSEYVASQVYQYQVQQIFVIHRETGTLLHTVANDPDRTKDADLMSSMLVAINDFVADAFHTAEQDTDNDIDEIKTEAFTLLTKIGPQAIIVAAVSGSVPPEIRAKLQVTLEEFHRFYQKPLQDYQGDNSSFAGCETLLTDCLVSERKDTSTKKKSLLMGGIVIGVALLAIIYLIFVRLELSLLQSDINELPRPAGIVVTSNRVQDGQVHLDVMRDPSAVSINEWLRQHSIDAQVLSINESPYASMSQDVIQQKLANVLVQYPSLTYLNNELSGSLTAYEAKQFERALAAIPGIDTLAISVDKITVVTPNLSENTATEALLTALSGKLATKPIIFAPNQANVSAAQMDDITFVAGVIRQLQALAKQQQREMTLFVLGASDHTGASAHNQQLSESRAYSVIQALESLNIETRSLIPIGLGQVELAKPEMGRSVFFHVLFSSPNTHEVHTK